MVAEYLAAPGADDGGGDERLHGGIDQALEIDSVGKNVGKRIGRYRQVIWRHQPRHGFGGDVHRGIIEPLAAKNGIKRAALERTEAGAVEHLFPDGF